MSDGQCNLAFILNDLVAHHRSFEERSLVYGAAQETYHENDVPEVLYTFWKFHVVLCQSLIQKLIDRLC